MVALPSTNGSAIMRKRNYKREYERRIERALAAGKSRSAARGHPRAADLAAMPPSPIDRESRLEKALTRMRRGESQKAAAKAERVSAEGLRAYLNLNTTSKRQGRKWVISDQRPEGFWMATRGQLKAVTLARDLGSEVSAHWQALERFLESNKTAHLLPFVGKGVRDIQGRFHPFETDPNTLRRLDSIGELHFLEIYADVAK
jgi:hypothetical protein